MIHADWMKQFACPVCLDKAGCEKCGVVTGGHDVCMKSYASRVACAFIRASASSRVKPR